MSVDLNLPTFGLDCQDWLVATEADGLMIDEDDGAPVVAVLSTAIIRGAELTSARAVLSLALINDDDDSTAVSEPAEDGDHDDLGSEEDASSPGSAAFIDWAGQDICVLDADWATGYARFAVPAPGGVLAVVAEFTSAPDPSRELVDRFYDLVTSFRWAA